MEYIPYPILEEFLIAIDPWTLQELMDTNKNFHNLMVLDHLLILTKKMEEKKEVDAFVNFLTKRPTHLIINENDIPKYLLENTEILPKNYLVWTGQSFKFNSLPVKPRAVKQLLAKLAETGTIMYIPGKRHVKVNLLDDIMLNLRHEIMVDNRINPIIFSWFPELMNALFVLNRIRNNYFGLSFDGTDYIISAGRIVTPEEDGMPTEIYRLVLSEDEMIKVIYTLINVNATFMYGGQSLRG